MALEQKTSSSRVKSRSIAHEVRSSAGKTPHAPLRADAALRKGAGKVLRHDIAITLRRLVPYLLVGLVVFSLLIPVSTVAFLDQSLFNVSFTHDQLKFRFYLDSVAPVVVAACVVFGAVVAFGLFRFVTIRSESTARFSLSLSRGRLFAVRTVCGLVIVALAIGVPMAVSLVLNLWALGSWAGLHEHWAFVTCGLMLAAGVSFAIMAGSLALSGTTAEALLAYVAIIGCVSVGSYTADQLACALLLGNPYGETLLGSAAEVAPSLFALAAPINPLFFFADEAASAQTFSVLHPVYEPASCDWPIVAMWACLLVALVACAGLLFVRRRVEIAGLANTNKVLTAFVAVVIALAAFAAVVAVLASLSVVVGIAGAVAAFALTCILLLAGPLTKGSRNMRSGLLVTGVSTVCVSLVAVCVATGALGFSSTVPDASKVACVRVSYVGAPDFVPVKMDTASAGTGDYYYTARLGFSDDAAIETAVAAHRALVEAGSLPMDVTQTDFGQTVVPYDLVFEYTLTDGTTLTRYYDRAPYAVIASLLALDESDETKAREAAVVKGEIGTLPEAEREGASASLAAQAFAAGRVFMTDRLYAEPRELKLTESERAELLDAIAADVRAQGVEDRYHPDAPARGAIMFSQSGESDSSSFAYRLENSVVYLTDEYANTLAWIDANGLSDYLSVDSSVIEQLAFQRYDPHAPNSPDLDVLSIVFKGYRDVNPSSFVITQEWGSLYTTTDRAEIDEIAPLLRNTCAVDRGGYLVRAKLAGVQGYSYFYLPASDASTRLQELIG